MIRGLKKCPTQGGKMLRVVRIHAALLTRTGSESETESDMGDVSLGGGSMRKVETRGEDPSLS
jgi:hypothetical protein